MLAKILSQHLINVGKRTEQELETVHCIFCVLSTILTRYKTQLAFILEERKKNIKPLNHETHHIKPLWDMK